MNAEKYQRKSAEQNLRKSARKKEKYISRRWAQIKYADNRRKISA